MDSASVASSSSTSSAAVAEARSTKEAVEAGMELDVDPDTSAEVIDIDAIEVDEDKENASKHSKTQADSGKPSKMARNKRKSTAPASASRSENAETSDDDCVTVSSSSSITKAKQSTAKSVKPSKKPRLSSSTAASKKPTNGAATSAGGGAAASSSAVKEASSSLLSFKNGKLVPKQKKLDWSQQNIGLQLRIAWNGFFEELDDVLDAMPEEHLPLVALLVLESEKTLLELAKQVKASLCPPAVAVDDSQDSVSAAPVDKLPLAVLQRCIKTIAERFNHGFRDTKDRSESGETAAAAAADVEKDEDEEEVERDLPHGYDIVPPGLRVWRWELKDSFTTSETYQNAVPEEVRKKVQSRREERLGWREEAKKVLASMSEAEQREILTKGLKGADGQKETGNTATKDKEKAKSESSTASKGKAKGKAEKVAVKKEEEADEDTEMTPEVEDEEGNGKAKGKGRGRPKKELTEEERLAKEAEAAAKEEKKAEAAERKRVKDEAKAKKDAEKAKKEEGKKKQANYFGAWLGKAESPSIEIVERKPAPASSSESVQSSPTKPSDQGPSSTSTLSGTPGPASTSACASASASGSGAVNTLSVKKSGKSDYHVAFKPFNVRQGVEVAPINAFRKSASMAKKEELGADHDMEEEWSAENSLKQLLASACPSRMPSKKPSSEREHYSVDGLMLAIQEAELASNTTEAARLSAILRNPAKVPLKLFKFATDVRPGYFGTWSKKTEVVNARNPFKKDTSLLDYEYDSEAEWDEDPADAEDVEELGEDGDSDDEPDSDVDSWLAGDDEEIEMESGWEEHLMSLDNPDDPLAGSALENAKKTMKSSKTTAKKRKVTALVPVIKGPYFAINASDEDEVEPVRRFLESFSMQYLGGNEFGTLDPFFSVEKKTRTNYKAAAVITSGAAPAAGTATKGPAGPMMVKKSLLPSAHIPFFNTIVLASVATTKPKLMEELVAAFDKENIKVSKAVLDRQVGESVNKKKKEQLNGSDCVWELVPKQTV